MKISFLTSDEDHPINSVLERLISSWNGVHVCQLVRSKSDLAGGDFLFLISCSEKISLEDRSKYQHSLVLHASDLPLGRGWSPHIWQIIEGKTEIILSLLEVEDVIDSGRIWKQKVCKIPTAALWDEINEIIFSAEVELIEFAVREFESVVPSRQDSEKRPTYYAKRSPADSELNPEVSIADQFDLIRVCDPTRFPAFFYFRGKRFKLYLEEEL